MTYKMTYKDIAIAFSCMPQEKIIKPDDNCKYNIWLEMNKYIKSIVIWEDGYDPFNQCNKLNPIHFNGIYLIKNIAAVVIAGRITYHNMNDQVTTEIDPAVLEFIGEYVRYINNYDITGDDIVLRGYHLASMANYINKYNCKNNGIINSIEPTFEDDCKYIYQYQFQTLNPSIRLQFRGINSFDYNKLYPDATAVKCQYYNDSEWITEYSCFITNRSTRFIIASQSAKWFKNETEIVKSYRQFAQVGMSSADFFDIINNYTSQKYMIYAERLFARVYIINNIYHCEYNDLFEEDTKLPICNI